MRTSKINNFINLLLLMLVSTITLNAFAEDQAGFSNRIEKVDFVSMSGGRVAVRVHTTKPLSAIPAGFTLNNPPRIALDFLDVGNGLAKNNLTANQGDLKSISLVQAKDRSRMVLNLAKEVAYSSSISGNDVTILLQANGATAQAETAVERFAESKLGDDKHDITNVDFMRGKNGEGRVIIDLSDATTGINLQQKGKTIVVDFINADLPEKLQRRLNVVNFNTPVLYVDTMKQGKNTRMVIEPKGLWEQSAYQADKRFIVDVRPVVEDPNKLVQGSKPGYAGEKLSLNFQNIDVRSVLQVIADFTSLNIVTSDSVTGNITLRLKDVPWDQALDIILKSKNLAQRKVGNVVVVAPADEVVAKEKLALEATQQIEELEPMRTEIFTLKYMKAEDLKTLLTDEKQKILSKRGSAAIDARTNTVFVQDNAKRIQDIQRIINTIDIAVKQVMIESRLVIADEKFAKNLGARFGIQKQGQGNSNLSVSGSLGNTVTSRSTTTNAAGETTVTETLSGQTGSSNLAASQTAAVGTSPNASQDLMSNLPVTGAFGSIAASLFRLPAGFLLNLELSALESDNRGKVVSSPRVTTANQQKATIEQGTEIPYITPASGASTTPAIAFKKAVLSLEVTPQITPDNKIIMDLSVKKDRVGQVFNNVPSIDTQNVKTQVLVANGETAVLGGIFEQTQLNQVSKVPFFGDIPFVGNAFKRTIKQNDKTELLIFITPKVLDENLSIR